MKNQPEEGNRIIAEFMGFDYNRSLPGHGGTVVMTLTINDCLYHSSWDWLMPVVEKINSLEDGIYKIGVYPKWGGASVGDNTHFNDEADEPIEQLFKAVIHFIKWYNTQTTQSETK